MKTINNDNGTLFVGSNLPKEFQKQGVPEEVLHIRLAGEDKARKVSYIMGSQKKGWYLAAKGTGPFPTVKTGTAEVEFELE